MFCSGCLLCLLYFYLCLSFLFSVSSSFVPLSFLLLLPLSCPVPSLLLLSLLLLRVACCVLVLVSPCVVLPVGGGWVGCAVWVSWFELGWEVLVVSIRCIFAPFPGVVAPSVRYFGGCFVCMRPSLRSFSGWVLVGFFPSFACAGEFAAFASRCLSPCSVFFSSGVVRCSVRRRGSWWCVSVPVLPGGVFTASDYCTCVFAQVS